jgi:L-lactate utilization protein LutC
VSRLYKVNNKTLYEFVKKYSNKKTSDAIHRLCEDIKTYCIKTNTKTLDKHIVNKVEKMGHIKVIKIKDYRK